MPFRGSTPNAHFCVKHIKHEEKRQRETADDTHRENILVFLTEIFQFPER